jgi:hypothetical protein
MKCLLENNKTSCFYFYKEKHNEGGKQGKNGTTGFSVPKNSKSSIRESWMWGCMSITPILGRLRQKDDEPGLHRETLSLKG